MLIKLTRNGLKVISTPNRWFPSAIYGHLLLVAQRGGEFCVVKEALGQNPCRSCFPVDTASFPYKTKLVHTPTPTTDSGPHQASTKGLLWMCPGNCHLDPAMLSFWDEIMKLKHWGHHAIGHKAQYNFLHRCYLYYLVSTYNVLSITLNTFPEVAHLILPITPETETLSPNYKWGN